MVVRDIAIIKKFLWEAWFSLECGRKAAFKGDINYAVGSVFRAVCSWVEVLYAVNNLYLNCKPADMEHRVKTVYVLLMDGSTKETYQILDGLHGEISGSSEIKPETTKIR